MKGIGNRIVRQHFIFNLNQIALRRHGVRLQEKVWYRINIWLDSSKFGSCKRANSCIFNPILPNVFQRVKSPGGHPLEINKGVPWDLMLLKVILKPIKDHMQKIIPISQNYSEILTFENLDKMRFCHTLTYENRQNSLNFWEFFWI